VAKKPQQVQFNLMDFPEEMRGALEDLFKELRRFIDGVRTSFANELTEAQNLRLQENRVSYTDAGGVTFPWLSPGRPWSVRVPAATPTDVADRTRISGPKVEWEYENGEITITGIDGITGSDEYDLVVHTYGEDATAEES